MWILFLAATIYHGHPALETLQRPSPIDGKENWIPQSYNEFWRFKVKAGVSSVRFDHLGYAHEAQQSYREFCALRAAGVIPAGVRFQVSLPLPEDATRLFVTNADDFALLSAAYEEAMGREIAQIVAAIPVDDLVIQWDICVEVLAVELKDDMRAPWKPPGDPFARYLRALKAVAQYVPEQTLMGCHLCYGDFQHQHFVEPTDLSVVVRMANAACQEVTRPIDYYHMPVPRNRDDAAYFAPLKDLEIGEAKLYLGLVHYTDGAEGTLRRVRAARGAVSGFGISTECGFGRRPKETIPELLRIHREVAGAL
jgi:methionine synthase II (cobalamin-independent)